MTSLIESVVAGLAIVLASTVCIPKVLAEPSELNLNNTETIPEAIDRAATRSSLLAEDNFFSDRSVGGDAAFTFGIGYDEDKLAREARRLGAISQDLLNQQASQDPTIRTQDLPNPYSASLLNDTELTDIQAEPSGTEQPSRANPTDTESENIEEPTEAEPSNTEDSTEEDNDTEDSTEAEPSNTEDSTETEPNTTKTESNDTEDSTEAEPSNTEDSTEEESNTTETEPNTTEDSTEEESNTTDDSTETEP